MRCFTRTVVLSIFIQLLFATSPARAKQKYKVLIVDGQSNHRIWPESTQLLKKHLEETKIFVVDIATTPPAGEPTRPFQPPFFDYDVVVSNYNGESWPANTKWAFEKYVKGGGGFVSVHAANNAFPEWAAYNAMIGVGGWGDRTEQHGPMLRFRKGEFVADMTPGIGGSHGIRHEFQVVIRNADHPITAGLPSTWMHSEDELYDRLRGPAKDVTVLASAYSAPETQGTGEHEPILMAISYGKGRVFHTTLGHSLVAMRCEGFIATFQRGVEWAASSTVTQQVRENFPSAEKSQGRR